MPDATPRTGSTAGRHARAVLLAALALALPAIPLAPGTAQAAGPGQDASALAAFQSRHETVVTLVRKHASAAKLQQEVDDLLDYAWIARAALGGTGKYQESCQPRCSEFEGLLTRLIRENYLRLVRKAESHPVEYVGELKGRKGAVKVTTRIQIEKNGRKQKLEVAYVMHLGPDGWEVRDIITDGMSLAKTYRYEFNQIRKREGIDGVIHKLESKLAEVAKMD
jgi:phospholipid transport system substrate-binding protein